MGLAVPKMNNWWDQHNLTVEEASAYFRIGEHTVRRLIANNPDANFILRVGTRTLIKKCDCGKTTTVSSVDLVTGNTKSCGCLGNHFAKRNLLKGGFYGKNKF